MFKLYIFDSIDFLRVLNMYIDKLHQYAISGVIENVSWEGIKINVYGKLVEGISLTPPLHNVIKNKRGNKTLVLNNFTFFIG
jgi:hypothetical protein